MRTNETNREEEVPLVLELRLEREGPPENVLLLEDARSFHRDIGYSHRVHINQQICLAISDQGTPRRSHSLPIEAMMRRLFVVKALFRVRNRDERNICLGCVGTSPRRHRLANHGRVGH